jgi:hypothetical protein
VTVISTSIRKIKPKIFFGKVASHEQLLTSDGSDHDMLLAHCKTFRFSLNNLTYMYTLCHGGGRCIRI